MEKLRASEVFEYHLVSLTQMARISGPRQDLNPSEKPTKNSFRMDPHKKGQAPYGFRWQGGQLLSEEAESQTMRMAFKLFLKLKSMGAVARSLIAGQQAHPAGRNMARCPSGADPGQESTALQMTISSPSLS